MKNKFFEGKDFGKGDFRALIPKYYPKEYQNYIKEETRLLKKKIKNSGKILEAGVGIGRLIPELSHLVKEFVGVDKAKLMLKKSKEIATSFSNVKIIDGKLEHLSKIFPKNYFDFSLCVWNTLGNVDDEVKILKEISKITSKSVFVTVYKKGTIKERKNWYKTVGIDISKIDEENEIFFSNSGLKSKSYNLEDLKLISKKAGLKVVDYKILSGVILWIELKK